MFHSQVLPVVDCFPGKTKQFYGERVVNSVVTVSIKDRMDFKLPFKKAGLLSRPSADLEG